MQTEQTSMKSYCPLAYKPAISIYSFTFVYRKRLPLSIKTDKAKRQL